MIEGSCNNNVLLLGQPKTGTTALFFALKEAMPAGVRALFEPKQYVPQISDTDTGVLAKVLTLPGVDYASFSLFDKKILITRDPRDQKVSDLLYLPYELYHNDPERLGRFLSLLVQKEEAPTSVSMRELWEAHYPANRLVAILQTSLTRFFEAESFFDPVFLLRYEDFVDGKLKPLEDFLGWSINNTPQIHPCFQRVVRTKSYGYWRHWFTKEDIDFFQPIFAKYVDRYNYNGDWALEDDPRIDKARSSEYVLRIVNERRKENKRELVKIAGGSVAGAKGGIVIEKNDDVAAPLQLDRTTQ